MEERIKRIEKILEIKKKEREKEVKCFNKEFKGKRRRG